MKKTLISQNEKVLTMPTPMSAAPSTQTSIAVRPSRDAVSKRSCSTHLDQGAASVFCVKLIAERAGITTQVLHAVYDQRFDAYAHWGTNE